MEKEDWENLAHLSELDIQHKLSPVGYDNYHTLLNKTKKADECPEDYNGPCLCKLCMSYAEGGIIE